MRKVYLTFTAIVFLFAVLVSASDYLNDNLGEIMRYKGTFISSNNEKLEFTQATEVLNPKIIEGAEYQIVQLTILQGSFGSEEKVQMYGIKDDGIYLMAYSNRLGGEIAVLETPILEYPLPLEKGKKWHRTRAEGGGVSDMDFEVMEVDQTVKVLDREEQAIYIKGTGTYTKQGKTFKSSKEIWVNRLDKIRQITRNEDTSGKADISEIQLEKIEPAPTAGPETGTKAQEPVTETPEADTGEGQPKSEQL